MAWRVWKQFWLLTWKNFIVLKRSIIWTIVEIVIPLVFALITFYVSTKLPGTHDFGRDGTPIVRLSGTNDDFASDECSHQCSYISHNSTNYALLYSFPDSVSMADANELFGLVGTSLQHPGNMTLSPKAVSSKNDMLTMLEDGDDMNNCDRPNIAGVYINTLAKDSRKFEYELWLNKDMGDMELSKEYTGNSQFDPDNYNYNIRYQCESGMFTYQLALDNAFAQICGGIASPSDLYFHGFPTRDHDDYAVSVILPYIYIVFTIMTLTVVLHTTRSIAAEKENKMKDYLMVMGMGRGVFFCSHIFFAFLKTFVVLIINCIPFILMLKLANPAVIIISVLFYGMAVICVGAVIAALCTRASFAMQLVILVEIILAVLAAVKPNPENIGLSLLASLNPNTALSYVFTQIQESTYREQKLGIADGFKEANQVFGYGPAVCMLALDVILFTFLTFLADWLTTSSDSPLKLVSKCFSRNKVRPEARAVRVVSGAEEVDAALESTMADIEIVNVAKEFDGGERAVDDLTMKAYRNQVTVLLGHNGAGKSTTFNMVTGLLAPTSGSLYINGINIQGNLSECQDRIIYCPQDNPLFTLLTVDEHIEFFARMKGVEASQWKEDRDLLLDILQLTDKKSTRSVNLSGGMKRKLCVGMALIARSKVILLDEPTAGMDPGARRDIERLLQEYKKDTTILMTTHYTDEAEKLGERIVIMASGRVICSGTSQFLKKRFDMGYILSLVLTERDEKRELRIIEEVKKHVGDAFIKSINGVQMEIILPKEDAERFPQLFKDIEEKSVQLGISSFGLSLNSLEQVFLKAGELSENAETSEEDVLARVKDVVLAQKMEGFGLKRLALQVVALLRKRALFTFHHKWNFFCQIILPMLFIVFYSVLLPLIQAYVEADERSLSMSEIPHSRLAIFEAGMPPDFLDSFRNTMSKFKNIELESVAQNVSVDEWYVADPPRRPALSSGISAETGDIVLLYSQSYQLVMPPLILVYDSSRYNIDVTASVHEFEPTSDSEYFYTSAQQQQQKSDAIKLSLTAPAVILAYSMLSSPFIFQPVVDRTTKFAHQQHLAGISPFLYWGSHLLYDAIIYFVGGGLFIGLFAIWQWMTGYLALFLLLTVAYFWASIFFIYGLSYIFDSPTKGQVILNVYQVIITLVGFFIVLLTQIVPTIIFSTQLEDVLMLLIPSYGLVKGAALIAVQAYLQKTAGIPADELFNLWDWKNLGRIMIFMAITGTVQFVLFCLFQVKSIRKMFSKLWQSMRYGSIQKSKDDAEEWNSSKEDLSGTSISSLALSINDLHKTYGRLTAVDHLSFGVSQGECFGLLGVNGAGKTTTFSIITGEAFPTAGSATIFGDSVTDDVVRLGYCPQADALLPELTGRQTLEILATLHGFEDARSKATAVLKAVGMEEHGHKRTAKYSGGQRRKLSVGVAILAQQRLIILDEPTAGIDPKARRDIWSLLVCLRDEGETALLLTSHSMDECEALCSRIGVLSKGKLAALGTAQHLKSTYGNTYTLTLVLSDGSSKEQVTAKVQEFFPSASLRPTESSTLNYTIARTQGDRWSDAFSRAIDVSKAVNAVDFCLSQSSLEQTFMLIAKEAQEQ